MSDYESCEDCGYIHCECDAEADGYECGDCGSIPTNRELQRGTCTTCAEDRRLEREMREQATKQLKTLTANQLKALSKLDGPKRTMNSLEKRGMILTGFDGRKKQRFYLGDLVLEEAGISPST